MNSLAIVALASLAANVALGGLWLSARDEVARAGEKTASAQQAAGMCSRGVEEMRARAITAHKLASAARQAATDRAAVAAARADEILARPPAVPGDACASARADIDAWLGGRVP